jgi:uncharacterized RDD family membrane protein YckC
MKMFSMYRLCGVLVLLVMTVAGHAQSPTKSATASASTAVSAKEAPPDSKAEADHPPASIETHESADSTDSTDSADSADSGYHHGHRHKRSRAHDGDSDVVSIGHDSELAAGQKADSVVSILGSSTSAGEAVDVVSILGNTRITGPVKENSVSIVGNTYIDAKVDGDVVAVVGNVELGPHAEIDGNVVAVLGTVKRDPAAIIRGSVENVITGDLGDFSGMHAWIRHCLLYGRPLALVGGIGWAWTLAVVFLGIYICFALAFRGGLMACVQTLETRPGRTALAALLSVLLTPVLIVLLCFTVVGIAAVPFLVIGLFFAVLFGTAVMLACIGRAVTNRSAAIGHPALAVLIGGVIVIGLYLVPVVGFLVYKLLGILGLGAVVYTLILNVRAHQNAKADKFNSRASTVDATAAAATVAAAATDAAATDAAATDASPAAAASTPGAGAAAAAVPPSAPVSATPSAALPHAGFWVRMAALFLDVLLVGFVLKLLHPIGEVHLLVLAAYGAIMWKLRGSTVGGVVFDLHVVRLDGRPVDWETAIVRALGCFLSLAVVGLGFIWIAFDGAGQAWHDKIAGTVVVRTPKPLRSP